MPRARVAFQRLAARRLGPPVGRCSSLARELLRPDAELAGALWRGVAAHRAERGAVRPPPHLPQLPAALQWQLGTWLEESEAASEDAPPGRRAYSYSVPMLVASLLGRADKAGELGATMIHHLDEVLDSLVVDRVAKDPAQIEVVQDPFEAWAWAYLLMHYASQRDCDHVQWLKATRMLWAATEIAADRASSGDSEHSNRMWINTLTLLALSMQGNSGPARDDPLGKASISEMYHDAERLFCSRSVGAHEEARQTLRRAPGIGAETSDVASIPLSFGDALRHIPSSDFRTWAVGLTQLAGVQARVLTHEGHLEAGELDETFVEALQSSVSTGDKALGVTNWIYAAYIGMWWDSVC